MDAFTSFMTGIIDYAGLFPPAKLDMTPAVQHYAKYRVDDDAWMLATFVCPATRLDEFLDAAGDLLSPDDPWPLSVLVGEDVAGGLQLIYNALEKSNGGIEVPMVEAKATRLEHIDAGLKALPDEVIAFFEIDHRSDPRGLIAALAGTAHAAKIRTGGVTADLFPSSDEIARFMIACRDAEVPFKATAGLHHPVRHHDETVNCVMHGFLNVFGAAAAIWTGDAGLAKAGEILNLEDAAAFSFDDDTFRINDLAFSTDAIEDMRDWARSFGSCSFEEPREDLFALGMIKESPGNPSSPADD